MNRLTVLSVFLLSLLILLGPALSTPFAYASDGDDWVLVKRFEEQHTKANAGDIRAMYELGRLYERGRGTEINMREAIQWFEKAASKGQSQARARLGILYLEGQGVPQDYTKAYDNLSVAANVGIPPAQYFLALMYEQGQGVSVNTTIALNWYKKAAKGGYYQAEKGIARLEAERPTLEQPAEANRSVKQAPIRKQPKSNLAQGLIEIVLNGRWQRHGEPVGFLPSSAAICRQQSKEIKCLSSELTRDTGFSVITYVTEATLSGFNAHDEFSISYHNNVLRTGQDKKSHPASDDEEEYSANVTTATSRVQLGRQKTEHHLECTMENASKIVCIKNLTTTQTFDNKRH